LQSGLGELWYNVRLDFCNNVIARNEAITRDDIYNKNKYSWSGNAG